MAISVTSVAPSGPPMTSTINIVRRSQLGIMPEALLFEVDVSAAGFNAVGPSGGELYDEQFHRLEYYWDFGDDGASAYNYTKPRNLPAAFLNSNIGFGPLESHTYRADGNFTVTCLIWEVGTANVSQASLPVTIDPVGTTFSGTNTIFVDPDSDWANAPAGAQTTNVSNLATVLSTYVEGATVPKKVLLNAGKTYSFSGHTLGNNSHIHIMRVGTGNNPVVNFTSGLVYNGTAVLAKDRDFVFQGIDCFGPHNSSDGTGAVFNGFSINAYSPYIMLLDDVVLDGFNHCLYQGHPTDTDHRCTVLNDTLITNYYQWGFADWHGAFSVMNGTAVRGKVDALADNTDVAGAPYRGGNMPWICCRSSEFFSRQSWWPPGSLPKHIQPGVRFNSEGHRGAHINVQSSYFEGGNGGLGITVASGSTMDAGNVVLERNRCMGGYQGGQPISCGMGGATIRNNILVQHNVVVGLGTSNSPSSFVGAGGSGANGTAENNDAPLEMYGNTCLNFMRAENYFDYATWGAPDMIVLASGGNPAQGAWNNIDHQAYVDNPNIWPVALEMTPNQHVPWDIGYKDSVEYIPETGTALHSITVSVSTAFTSGNTLTNGTATALIYFTDAGGTLLWLGPVTGGSFSNTDSLTETDGPGAGTATGDQADSGFFASFIPATGANWTTGLVPKLDYLGNVRPATPSIGAREPA